MSLEGMVFSLHGFSALKKKEVTTILRDYGAEIAYVGKNVIACEKTNLTDFIDHSPYHYC